MIKISRYVDLDKSDKWDCGMRYCDVFDNQCAKCYGVLNGYDDVIPVTKSHWNNMYADNKFIFASCSLCEKTVNLPDYKFCPWCGSPKIY